MRNLYTRMLLGLLAMLCGVFSYAQISVTATAGTTGPTTYTTLKGAFDAINAGTHQGDITISVTASTTETGEDSLVASGTGAASYSSILIKPAAGVTATISGNISSFLLEFNGADNVTIDGSNTVGGTTKDLTFENTHNTGTTIFLNNSASNNVIKNTILRSGGSGGAAVIAIGFAAGALPTGNDANIIENNDITGLAAGTGPSFGIFNLGTAGKPNTGNIIRNNRIFDFNGQGYQDGDGANPIGYSNNTLIEGNEFFHTTARTASTRAILLISLGVSNMMISKNFIHDINSTVATSTSLVAGIQVYDVGSVTISNNMILMNQASTPGSVFGILQEAAAGATVAVYHNTVLVSGTASGVQESAAFQKDWSSAGDDVRNNIFVNTRITSGTGGQYAITNVSSGGSAGTMSSNYNNLVSTGSANNHVGASATTNYTTLASWQAASSGDANSVNIDPVFASATDLHLTPASNSALDNLGTPIATVTTDIDGDARSATTPDMGADEFSAGPPCDITITTQPSAQAACTGNNVTFTVAATTGTGTLTYQWRRNGANIAGATSASYTVAASAATAGNYDVVVSNGTCSVTSSAVALTENTAPAITTHPTSITVCQGNASFSVVATGTGLTYQWQVNGTPVPGATAATASVPIASIPNGAYTVNVVVTNACGSTTSNNATLTVSTPCTSVPNVNEEVSSMLMMPNVVRDMATLRVNVLRTMKMNFNVVDAQGRVVMTLSRQVLAGQNDISLYLGQLSAGTYQLQGATDKGAATTIRFVKQ